jgi:hypothetical protein
MRTKTCVTPSDETPETEVPPLARIAVFVVIEVPRSNWEATGSISVAPHGVGGDG